MISGFIRSVHKLSERVGNVVSFLIVVAAFVIGYEVVARYVFNKPTIWAHETSIMLFGAFGVLGGAYTLLHQSHVNMDVIYGRLSVKTKALLDVITFIFFAFFCGVLLWGGAKTAWKSLLILEHASTIWEPPIYPFKLLLPVGALLLLLQGLAKFVEDLITLKRGGRK